MTVVKTRNWQLEYAQAHLLILELVKALEDTAIKTTVAEAIDWNAHREHNIAPVLAAYRAWMTES